MVQNDLLMQFQADILDVDVIRPAVAETTALGRGLRRRPRRRLLDRAGGPARELGRGQALDARRWTRSSARPSTATGRRRSRAPSTGWRRNSQPRPSRVTSSSSAAARPASGSFATSPCGASARSWWSASTSARAPPAASTACSTRAGRYVTSDPQSATECAQESAILRRIASQAIEDTGGLFVTTPADDPELRRPVPGRLPRHRGAGPGDPDRRGAGARAADQPGDHPRLRGGGRRGRRLEAALGQRPLGRGATARASSPTTG